MFFSQSKKIIIGLSLAVILVILIVTLPKLKKGPLEVLQVSPVPASQNIDAKTTINLIFNQKPLMKDISFKTEPEFKFNQEVFNQSLLITPEKTLEEGTTYQIEVLFKNKNIFVWSFSTREFTETEEIEVEIEETKRMYPLIDYLPLETDSYHLTYIKPMTLQVTLKIEDKKKVEKEIKEWIKSKGIDPSTHQITFTTPES